MTRFSLIQMIFLLFSLIQTPVLQTGVGTIFGSPKYFLGGVEGGEKGDKSLTKIVQVKKVAKYKSILQLSMLE